MSATVVYMRAIGRRGSATKAARSRQRRALRGQAPSIVAAAIVNPPRELATYKLRLLFGPKEGGSERGLVPGVGEARLRRVLAGLAADRDLPRQNWHSELRLNELTPREREHLALALIAAAPPSWRDLHHPSSSPQTEPERKAS